MSGHGSEYLEIDDVSRTLAVLGFYVSVFGLASYTVKERLYMSDALVALLVGIAVGPIAWNLVNPSDWTSGNEELTNRITYELARIVIGVQVLFTGIALPKAYLKHAWESLTTLLLGVMTCAWLISAAFIYALIPGLTYLESLCIAACVTPTDPVLANSVVKGRFAEKHIPPHVRNLIAAESGANDGLGFPFIYLAIYLISRFVDNRSIGNEIGWWVVDIWLYQIALSCAIGATIGFLARKAVKYAEEKKLIDHESFLAIGVGLTFFTLGVTGILGSDDILAAFIVGNSFTWDDYFRVRTEDESFQDVLDSLINTGIFIYIGAVLPWSDFGNAEIGLSAWRLVVLGILVMLFRRLPFVLAFKGLIPDLVTWQEALFTGWFGPIGVGAVYYAQVGLRRIPEDRTALRDLIVPVVYFIVLCSVIVHGITIPIFKHTPKIYHRTRSLTTTRSSGTRDDLATKFKNLRPGGSSANGDAAGDGNGAAAAGKRDGDGGAGRGEDGGSLEMAEAGESTTHSPTSAGQDGAVSPNGTLSQSRNSTRPSTPVYPRPGTITPAQRNAKAAAQAPVKKKDYEESPGKNSNGGGGGDRNGKVTFALPGFRKGKPETGKSASAPGSGASTPTTSEAPPTGQAGAAQSGQQKNAGWHVPHETPRSDDRGNQSHSFIEGNNVVTEGADGVIHVEPRQE